MSSWWSVNQLAIPGTGVAFIGEEKHLVSIGEEVVDTWNQGTMDNMLTAVDMIASRRIMQKINKGILKCKIFKF